MGLLFVLFAGFCVTLMGAVIFMAGRSPSAWVTAAFVAPLCGALGRWTLPRRVSSSTTSVFDTCSGGPAGCKPSSRQVTVDSAGRVLPVTYYGLSGDGRYLAFSGGTKGYLARTGF